jgi:hypothetical protein
MSPVMAREYELNLNATDAAILVAIRYLDPDLNDTGEEDNGAAVVICAFLAIAVLSCLGLIWLWRRI